MEVRFPELGPGAGVGEFTEVLGAGAERDSQDSRNTTVTQTFWLVMNTDAGATTPSLYSSVGREGDIRRRDE